MNAKAVSWVDFCRRLRREGFSNGPERTADVLRAVPLAADPEKLYFCLRSILCSDREEWIRFERLFRPKRPPRKAAGAPGGAREKGSSMFSPQRGGRERASDREALRKKDFSAMTFGERKVLEKRLSSLMRRVSRRKRRGFGRWTRRRDLDLRRMMRGSLASGGELFTPLRRRRRRSLRRFTLLLDVSGSMEGFREFALLFAVATGNVFPRTETYLLSTRLERVTDSIRRGRLDETLRALSRREHGWSGGTTLGECVSGLNASLRGRGGRSTVIVFSDGLDRGEPEKLADELSRLRRHEERIVWLNPLSGSPDYEPAAGGMRAALPHIDLFAPANNLENLERCLRHV